MISKLFALSHEDLRRMRKDAGLGQDELAYLMYKDASKRQRIGKLERGEAKLTFSEGLAWFKHCSIGVDREEVMKAIQTLEKASKS